MTNQEIDEQFDKEFAKLDNNKIFRDFCEKYAPAGIFHELHDDNLQSMIAELLAERDEALRKEIQEISNNTYEDTNPFYVLGKVASLLSKE